MQRDKYYTFEDPKSSTNDATTTAASTQEWLDTIERAKGIAISQSMTNSYCPDDAFRDLPSPASTLGGETGLHAENGSGRNTLQKYQRDSDAESNKGRKRFSKRQSKSGLTAVF